jgi:cytochrome c5
MSGHMSEEFDFKKIIAWALVIALGSIVLLVSLVSIASNSAKTIKHADEEAVLASIAPVAKVTLAAGGAAAAGPRTGEALYTAACSACHGSGAAGAPKLGDNGAWAGRIKQGLDGLVKSATTGKGAMPPKGGSDASDVEMARVVAYMANKSGAKFAEPK